MTLRDNSRSINMTRLDECYHETMGSPENINGLLDLLDQSPSPQPGKNSSVGNKRSSSDVYLSHESPRSASSSRPCSRPQSRHGSLPGSRIASRTNSQESIIDLFDSILTLNGKFASPKPKPFKETKLHWRDKVRMNHAIWRAWHIQYVKKKKPVICQFGAPEPDERARLQSDIIQGGIPNLPHPSNLGMHVEHYNNWRLYHKDIVKCSFMRKDDPEEDAIDLDKPHPPLSPMLAKNLANDDTLKDFSDTLFISRTKKKFAAPTAKEITRKVHISDIIQPSLMTLEPDLDEDFFMDTLESLTELLTRTPTKECSMADVSNVGNASRSHFTEMMMSTESTFPVIVQSSNKPLTVSFNDVPPEASQKLFPADDSPLPYSQFPGSLPQTSQMGNNYSGDLTMPTTDMIDELLNSLSTSTNYSFQSMHQVSTEPVQVMSSFGTEQNMVSTTTKMEPSCMLQYRDPHPVSNNRQAVNKVVDGMMYQQRVDKMLPSMCNRNWNEQSPSNIPNWEMQSNAVTMTTRSDVQSGMVPIPISLHAAETRAQNFYPHEQMDYNESGLYAYSQSMSMHNPNKRDRMKAVSPHQSRTLTPLPETIGIALAGQLDTKDRGLQSPMSDREANLTPVVTPGYLSTASSAASSPGGPNDGTIPVEFEFQAPVSKKKRSCDLDSKQKEQRRRIQHLSSEHKRRNNIHVGLDEIQRIVCGAQSTNDKTSQATLLQKTSDHIKSLQNDIIMKKAEMNKLNEEIESLNDQINDVQEELPDTGAPVSTQNDHQLQAMFDQYVQESMTVNWKFWIFRMLIEPLFKSYLSTMASVSNSNFDDTLYGWLDQSCKLRNLRPLATKAVREVSKKTAILSNPQVLPEQIHELVKKEARSSMES